MDAEEAMELLANAPHLPDVILMDVMMPLVDGVKVWMEGD